MISYHHWLQTDHTDDPRPSAFTFAKRTVQTDEGVFQTTPEIPDKLQQNIGCHLWLANLEASAGTPPNVQLKPEIPRHPHPEGERTSVCDVSCENRISRADTTLSLRARIGVMWDVAIRLTLEGRTLEGSVQVTSEF